MSKKDKRKEAREEFRQADYYDLKTKAVEDLVTANEENSPPVSQEELRKYRSGPKLRVAEWFIFCFIKWWFPAAGCFFFMWGLGTYLPNQFDLLFVTAIGMGLVTELLTNNVLRFMEKTEGAADRWIMCSKRKSYMTFPLNILYSFVLVFFVYSTYSVINFTIIKVRNLTDAMPLGTEPILFGLFYLGWDLLFVAVKNTIAKSVKSARRKSGLR